MSKADNKRSIILGIFVLVGIGILFAAIFTLGGQQNRFAKKVEIKAVFDNVEGLKTGNNIWFSGVKIGIVKAVHFRDDRKVELVLGIDDKSHEYIRKNSTAKIGSDGLIGNKIIVIEGGSTDVPPVESGDELRTLKGTDTEKMMSTLQVNNENLVGITENIRQLSQKVLRGEGTIGAALTDSIMANNMRTMMASLTQAATNTNKVTAALANFTAKLNTQGSLANELLTDTVVYSNLRAAVAQLQGVTQTASALTTNLGQASEKLNTSLSSPDNTLGLLLSDKATATTIKQTMVNLEASTAKLDENMEALQHNFLLRGFFKKRDKEAAKAKEAEEKAQQ
ncbi:phospholipid/cholesterol/gamma-HCH transport system substrate-binding protein [bacterium A37T11]|nr:phospholipid/cholesterol/gamma-HCH transport system substrate-binding protein [bacterium A37T11]